MKKISSICLVLIISFISNVSFCQVDSLAKAQLDTLIFNFVKDIDSIKNLSPEEELRKLVKDPYETTKEFESRKNKIKNDFSSYQKEKLTESFKLYSNKNILGIVELDSVKYNPDNRIAKAYHQNINIPNNRGIPRMDCFVYPALKFPFAWKTKEGFGMTKTDIKLQRKIARDNDIIKNKGALEYHFKFFRGHHNLPSLRLTKIEWKIEDKTIWEWRGKTTIPLGINNKPLKGVNSSRKQKPAH